MLSHTMLESLGQTRREEMREQARRAALVNTARQARRAQRHQAERRRHAPLAGLTLRARRARRAAPAPDSL